MALAALAMYILGSTLEQTRHARIWALSFAIYTIGWGMVAGFGGRAARSAIPLIVNLTIAMAILCYFSGFQARRGEFIKYRLFAIGAIIILFDILILAVPSGDLILLVRRVFLPLLNTILYLAAVLLVAPRELEASATERSVIAMLLCAAFGNAILASFAVAERVGVLPAGSFAYLSVALATPVCAAMGLFTLMLIASDFSRERLRIIHTDPLTAVLNRTGFEQRAQRLIARARSPRRPMALILADIDRFKAINDRFGHLTGDTALVAFACCLADAAPASALVGRFGGEEFAILIDNEGAPGAVRHAEQARALTAQLTVPGGGEATLTASFGVAELLAGETLLDLYARADAALYLSKQEGRNRTTLDPARAA